MSEQDSSEPALKPIIKGSKLDGVTTIRLAYGFANGLSLKTIAKSNDLSEKTVRSFVIRARESLDQPAFAPWHGVGNVVPLFEEEVQDILTTNQTLAVMSGCYFNDTCRRNYRLGNRKSRFCRACPLLRTFTRRDSQSAAVHVIDAMHAFYGRLGLRRERRSHPVLLFRQRLIHTATIATLRKHSNKTGGGRLLAPSDHSALGAGTFLITLLDTLSEPTAELIARELDFPSADQSLDPLAAKVLKAFIDAMAKRRS